MRDEAWKIFKNTGSIEAYITFSQSKDILENNDVVDNENKRDNSENKGYTG